MDESIVPVNQISVRSSTGCEFSNPNEAEVVEIEDDPVKTVEKQMEDLNLSHKFNEKDVPQIFKTLINKQMKNIKESWLKLYSSECLLEFDDFHIRFEKKNDNWTVTYDKVNKTIKAVDAEKSIVDHFWFVLKNPSIKLEHFAIMAIEDSEANNHHSPKMDSEKLTILLQSMFNSIDHQIHTKVASCHGFNEDIFLSMLKHVKPGTLEEINSGIVWKKEGDYEKMVDIVGTEQWKQATRIFSLEVTPLKVEDLARCHMFWLELEIITPEDVLRATKHIFSFAGTKSRTLTCKKKQFDIDAVFNFLRSQNEGFQFTKIKLIDPDAKFTYIVAKSGRRALMYGNENSIAMLNTTD